VGEPAGKAQAPSPEPHRANPAFGTIVILKGNLASRQVPFFHEKGPGGQFAFGGFFLFQRQKWICRGNPRSQLGGRSNLIQVFQSVADNYHERLSKDRGFSPFRCGRRIKPSWSGDRP